MGNFWIIGGGKFGLRAARTLSQADSTIKITIIEKKKAVCRQLDRRGFTVVCMDGIQYLEHNLTDAQFPDWIIPAIPVHAAYEWIRLKLSKTNQIQTIAVPKGLVSALPNPIHARTGQLFLSIADFTCPASCPEPDEYCTHTGKARPLVLYEFLRSIQVNNLESIVIRSHQLAPGVGGYTPAALFKALRSIQKNQGPVLLSTACSCHGVMNAFNLSIDK